MKVEKIVSQLEDLKVHCEDMAKDNNEVWKNDVEAIQGAIEILSSGQEVKEAQETIRKLLEKENMNQQQLADKMGIARQNVSQSINRNAHGMRVDSFKKMVHALGYEVVVRKKS